MDAKEYTLKRRRMCEWYENNTGCAYCPLGKLYNCTLDDMEDDEIDKAVSIVENWEESEKTNSINTVQNWFNDVDIALTNMDKSINELAKRMANLENRLICSVDDFR